MSSIAPVANFDGKMIHIGRATRNDTWHNFELNSDDDNTPAFVGVGNALKIYMSMQLTDNEILVLDDLWVNLCWRQQAQTVDPEAGSASIPRVFDRDVIQGGGVSSGNVNSVVFIDTSVSRVTDGNFENVELKFQQIKVPVLNRSAYPFSTTVLTNSPAFPAYSGFIYECVAKADYLWAVLTSNPNTFSPSNRQSFFCMDIAVGANAQGQQPLISQ